MYLESGLQEAREGISVIAVFGAECQVPVLRSYDIRKGTRKADGPKDRRLERRMFARPMLISNSRRLKVGD